MVIDAGNTRVKVAYFEGQKQIETLTFNHVDGLDATALPGTIHHVIASSVSYPTQDLLKRIEATGSKLELTPLLPLPVTNLYATPATLGVDRIAAACGAWGLLPQRPALVVDVGTCINYEFVDAQGRYHGGAISPGLQMRFQAMHTFTSRLPLVSVALHPPLTGNSTETCMQSGVLNGMVAEIDGLVDRYLNLYPNLGVILCGGDYPLFENQLKHPIFVAPDLVLSGLNRILLHNVEN